MQNINHRHEKCILFMPFMLVAYFSSTFENESTKGDKVFCASKFFRKSSFIESKKTLKWNKRKIIKRKNLQINKKVALSIYLIWAFQNYNIMTLLQCVSLGINTHFCKHSVALIYTPILEIQKTINACQLWSKKCIWIIGKIKNDENIMDWIIRTKTLFFTKILFLRPKTPSTSSR